MVCRCTLIPSPKGRKTQGAFSYLFFYFLLTSALALTLVASTLASALTRKEAVEVAVEGYIVIVGYIRYSWEAVLPYRAVAYPNHTSK